MKGVREGVVLMAVASTFCLYYVYNHTGMETMDATVSSTTRQRLETEKDTDMTTNKRAFADMDMASRRKFVARRCHEINKWNTRNMKEQGESTMTFFVNHKYKLNVCANLKVGSSTITNIIYSLHNNTILSHNMYRLHVLKQELTPQVVNILPYPTVMFVREPLERLFSAYRDGKGVRYLNKTKVSFEFFLRDVLKVDNYSLVDIHHMSYYDRCRPCDVNYDVIGTMKTFDEDLKSVLHDSMVDIDSIPRHHITRMSEETRKAVMANIPVEIKRAIWKRYLLDYYIFGYPRPF